MIFAAAPLLLILFLRFLKMIADIDESVSVLIIQEIWKIGFGMFPLKTAQTIPAPWHPGSITGSSQFPYAAFVTSGGRRSRVSWQWTLAMGDDFLDFGWAALYTY